MAEYSENDFILSLDNYLPDNSTEQISPKDIRDSFINLVDSSHRFFEPHNLKAKNIESAETRQTRVGELSLDNLHLPYQSGSDNTAIGYAAMNGNVYGDSNTAVGSYALSCNLDGDCNTAVGFGSIIGNIEGVGNVAIGNNTLSYLRAGNYNIAIGLGAGYYIGPTDSYQFFLGSHPSGCDIDCLDGSGTPLMRGDLQELKLAIGTNELHNYGTLQVSGDISPTNTRSFNLGNDNRAWRSINGQLVFPNSDTIESKSNIIPCYDGLDLGTPELRWDGFFRDVEIYGNLTVNGDSVCPSGSGLQRFAEGFFIEDVPAPIDFCNPTSGLFTEKRTCDGVCEDGPTYYAVNRDSNLNIYNGTYAQFAKHGTEWRPIWVSCTPTNPVTTTSTTTTTTQGPTTTTTTCEPTTTTTSGPTTTTTSTTPPPIVTCFTGDTLVKMYDGSYSRIDEIQIGDYVETSSSQRGEVVAINNPIVGDRGLLSINGSKFFATPDHVFKSDDGLWVTADKELSRDRFPAFDEIEKTATVKQMSIGDIIQTENGPIVVRDISIDKDESLENVQVYDLALDGDSDHTYYANGFVAHNCTLTTTSTTSEPTTTTTTTTTTTVSPQTCTYTFNGAQWDYSSGGSCGSCDCSVNFSNNHLSTLYFNNSGGSPSFGATITTTMSCTDCDVPLFGEGHIYISHT